jgi:hypothetical protein
MDNREPALIRAAKYDSIIDHYRILNETTEEQSIPTKSIEACNILLVRISDLQEENKRLIASNATLRKDYDRVWEHRNELLKSLTK